MNIKKLPLIYLSVFVLIIFSACAASLKGTIKDDGTEIPPEFGKEKTTVLVIKEGKKGFDKYLEKNFKSYYKGEYIILDRSEISSKKYPENNYRYVFDHTAEFSPGRTIGSERYPPTTDYKFFITDRKGGKSYKMNFYSGAFSKVMKAYISKMEEVRIKNS